MQELGLFFDLGNTRVSPLNLTALFQGKEKGNTGKATPGANGPEVFDRQPAPDAAGSAPLVFSTIVNGALGAITPGTFGSVLQTADSNTSTTGLNNSVAAAKGASINEAAMSHGVSISPIAAPATASTEQLVSGIDTLAFDIQLSKDENSVGPTSNVKSSVSNSASGTSDSAVKEPVINSVKPSADTIPGSRDQSAGGADTFVFDIQPSQAEIKFTRSEDKGDGLPSGPAAPSGLLPALAAELKPQTSTPSAADPQPKQTGPVLEAQLPGNHGIVGNSFDQISALNALPPAKDGKGSSSLAAAQIPVVSNLGMQTARDQSVIKNEPQVSSSLPNLPMEGHAVPTQSSLKSDLSVSMVGQSGETVNVRVSERGGEIQIAVRASDSATATEIRHELPAMQAGLERLGWHSETTSPTMHSSGQSSDSHASSESDRRNQQGWRNNSDGQPKQDRRRTPEQDRWSGLLQNAL